MRTATLKSRVAIVTGSSNGIGLAIAQQLLEHGCRVVLNGRRQKVVEQISLELEGAFPGHVATVTGDAAEPKVISELFEICERKFGHPADIVVSNAGRGLVGSPTTADLSQLDEVLKTNFVGVSHLFQETSKRFLDHLKGMRPLERPLDIVVLGSTVGRNLSPFSAVYGATKFAVHAVTEALRRELGPKGVRVSLIEPGIVESGFQDAAGYDETMVKGFNEKFGPLLKPNDIAETITFLLSLPPHVNLNEVMIRATRQDYP